MPVDSNIVVAAVTAVSTVIVAYMAHRQQISKLITEEKQNTQNVLHGYMTSLADANESFRNEIREELLRSRQREVELEQKVRELEERVTLLSRQNERLVSEKIEWMQKAMSLMVTVKSVEDKVRMDEPELNP
jgi:chromosome segregation ATPase